MYLKSRKMFIIYDFLTMFRNNYQVSKNTHNNDCFQRCNNLHYILQFSLSPPRSKDGNDAKNQNKETRKRWRNTITIYRVKIYLKFRSFYEKKYQWLNVLSKESLASRYSPRILIKIELKFRGFVNFSSN